MVVTSVGLGGPHLYEDISVPYMSRVRNICNICNRFLPFRNRVAKFSPYDWCLPFLFGSSFDVDWFPRRSSSQKSPPRPPPEGDGGQPHQRCISMYTYYYGYPHTTDDPIRDGGVAWPKQASSSWTAGTTPPHYHVVGKAVKYHTRLPHYVIGWVSRALPRENTRRLRYVLSR